MSKYDESMSLEENALYIALSLLGRRILSRKGWLDHDELRQSLSLYVLERMDGWDPERGALATHVGNLFDMWWKAQVGRFRAEAEHTWWFDPTWIDGEDENADVVNGRHVFRRAKEATIEETIKALDAQTGETDHSYSSKVYDLLDKLTEKQREAAELVWCDGLSASAAGERLGIRGWAVQHRLDLARVKLRKHYQMAS